MTNRSSDDERFSLRRWSQRKAAARAAPRADAARGETAPAVAPSAGAAMVATTPLVAVDTPAPASSLRAPAPASSPHAPGGTAASPLSPASALPSLDSLGIESDFTAFMQPGVDESLKRGALKKLFSDPRFNVMDGLDVYIDDYSKPDPIDPGIARTLAHARYIFNPPPTRVTAGGYVEDIPEEELRAAARDADPEATATTEVPAHDAAVACAPRKDTAPFIEQQKDDAALSIAQQPGTVLPATQAKPEVA